MIFNFVSNQPVNCFHRMMVPTNEIRNSEEMDGEYAEIPISLETGDSKPYLKLRDRAREFTATDYSRILIDNTGLLA